VGVEYYNSAFLTWVLRHVNAIYHRCIINNKLIQLHPNFPQNHFPLLMCFQNSETHKKWSPKGQTSHISSFTLMKKLPNKLKKQLCLHINCWLDICAKVVIVRLLLSVLTKISIL